MVGIKSEHICGSAVLEIEGEHDSLEHGWLISLIRLLFSRLFKDLESSRENAGVEQPIREDYVPWLI